MQKSKRAHLEFSEKSSMEIPEKLLKFRFHFLAGTIFSLSLFSFIKLAPSFLDVLSYFWPLLVSTALFLAAVVVFRRLSPPGTEVSGENHGEELLDFVAGQPDVAGQPEVSTDE
ncbi:hypothetical protein Nepgr_026885 [Nepenthes gracilis]|uniref:Uncharacterized protein n=1 Tax=Nepenthes gracilis TaxID=150966 RepID=A0AAD3T8Z5_NEPGR|nr:hypothetical protein Nepgr_026885 [Nepenthes gracilis]